jgi:hypothetical protein
MGLASQDLLPHSLGNFRIRHSRKGFSVNPLGQFPQFRECVRDDGNGFQDGMFFVKGGGLVKLKLEPKGKKPVCFAWELAGSKTNQPE